MQTLNPSLNLRAIFYALLGSSCMAGTDALMKWLLADYSVQQLLAFRGWLLLPTTLVWVLLQDGPVGLKPPEWRILVLRAALVVVAPFLFFTSLKTLPLADATVLFFTEPLFIILVSMVVFHDRVEFKGWLAVLAGFFGAIIALRPGIGVFQPEALLPIAAAFVFALVAVIARYLAGRSRMARILFFQSLAWAIVFTPFALSDWQPMSTEALALASLAAFLNLLMMIGLTKAYMLAPAQIVGPFGYITLPLAVVLGYLIWDELPDPAVYVGGAIIMLAGIYVIYREAAGRRAHIEGAA